MDADMQELEKGLAAVDQYDRESCADEESSLRELEACLAAIGPYLDRLETEHTTHLKATKGRFNVFTVLRGARKEAGLHTPWLAYLLNPTETHDCGDLFLRLFLKRISAGVQPHDIAGASFAPLVLGMPDAARHAKVSPESRIEGDQPDIRIDLPQWGEIIIENKIDAGEGERQLARYAGLLQKAKHPGRDTLLLFLTPKGDPSEQPVVGFEYYRISYAKHILDWLEDCLRETYQYININQALQQYRNVVYGIVHGCLPLEETFMGKIDAVVRMHPTVIKHYVKIGNAIGEMRKELYVIFWKEVNEHLRSDKIAIGDVSEYSYYSVWPLSILGPDALNVRTKLAIFFERQSYFFIAAWGMADVDKLDPGYTNKMGAALPNMRWRRDFSNCRAVVDLPETFTNDGLSAIVASPEERGKRVRESAEIIRQYVKEAKHLCPGLFSKG